MYVRVQLFRKIRGDRTSDEVVTHASSFAFHSFPNWEPMGNEAAVQERCSVHGVQYICGQ